MFTPPCDLSDAQVADAVQLGWGLAVESIVYAPVGFGSHHWTVDTSAGRRFVTADDLDAKRRSPAETKEATLDPVRWER